MVLQLAKHTMKLQRITHTTEHKQQTLELSVQAKQAILQHCIITGNSNHRLKSVVNMLICVLKEGFLCGGNVKNRPDFCIKTT